MNPEVYEIDENGFIINNYPINSDLSEIPKEKIVTKSLPQPNFYRPKWTGVEWIEGATPQEIAEMIKPKPSLPSEFDKIRLEQAQANAELIELIFGMSGGGV